MSYKIDMLWDAEASVWVATSEDVPGLVLESPSMDVLIKKIESAVPELMSLNGKDNANNGLVFQAVRTELIAAYG